MLSLVVPALGAFTVRGLRPGENVVGHGLGWVPAVLLGRYFVLASEIPVDLQESLDAQVLFKTVLPYRSFEFEKMFGFGRDGEFRAGEICCACVREWQPSGSVRLTEGPIRSTAVQVQYALWRRGE
eukprot:1426453-Rhodomonas_salina.1